MPGIDVATHIAVPAATAWEAMVDIEAFPSYMDSVREVRVVDEPEPGLRISRWSVTLRGSILEWTEQERIDPARRVIEFHQIDGDLARFEGTWRAVEADGGTVVELRADFEIGIPLLADMLNPVAVKALRENQEQMLFSLEQRVIGRP